MEEQRALEREQEGARRQQGDQVGPLTGPPPESGGGRAGDAGERGHPETGEAQGERDVQARSGEIHAARRPAYADGAVPEVSPSRGERQQRQGGHGPRPRSAGQPFATAGPAAQGPDHDGDEEGRGQELHEDRRGQEGAGRRGRQGRRARTAARRGRRRSQRHEPEGEGRDVGADHGGAIDDRRRESREQGREASAQRSGDRAHDQGRGEDAPEGEQQDRATHRGGVTGTARRQRVEADEEERRLGGEHVGAQRGAVREGAGAPQVDALVELGRVGRQVPARREADGQDDQAQGGGLGRARRGEPGAAPHRSPRYRRPGPPGSVATKGFTPSHPRGQAIGRPGIVPR
jgi:hypothetical protein